METFTTREATRLLGVSRRTLNRWLTTHAIERETSYGPSGVEYRYTRAALEHLLRQVRGEGAASQLDEGSPEGCASEPAQGRQDERSGGGQGETPHQVLALPPAAQVEEFLTLLADMRDVVARAAAAEGEVGAVRHQVERLADENRQLREVLAARLPAPSTPAPQPRVRWRACTEVALLGVVTVLAGAMVAAVARVLQINGAIVIPW